MEMIFSMQQGVLESDVGEKNDLTEDATLQSMVNSLGLLVGTGNESWGSTMGWTNEEVTC